MTTWEIGVLAASRVTDEPTCGVLGVPEPPPHAATTAAEKIKKNAILKRKSVTS